MRFRNVDFLKFIFAVLIVFFHGRRIIDLPIWLSGIPRSYVCVDFFFIIAGFLLFYKFKPEADTWQFAKKRFLRLAPNVWLCVFTLGILAHYVKGIHWNLDGNILRLFLLHCVGFSPLTGGTSSGYSWFISALFWVSIFYFYISKIFEKKYLNLIIWLLVMFCYVIGLQHNNFISFGQTDNVYLIFNYGVCRALASMGLGYFISMAYKEGILQKAGYKLKIFISIAEVYLIWFLSYYLISAPKLPGKTSMCYIIPFAILFYFMLIKKGIVSRLLDNNLSELLGKYAYAIYCFHWVVLPVFQHCIFKQYPLLLANRPVFAYFLQTLSAVIAGIVVYYIFELPVSNYINKKFLKKQD